MNASRFRAPPSRRLLAIVLLSIAALVGIGNSASAGSLAPGGNIANDGVNISAGTTLLVDTGLIAFTQKDASGTVTGTGTVREIVVSGDTSTALRGLDFIYQVHIDTGPPAGDVKTLSASSYNNTKVWATDASAVTAAAFNGVKSLLTTAFLADTAGGALFGATPISRNGPGSVVSFDFNSGTFGASQTSEVLIVRTDAPTFIPGTINILDNSSLPIAGYAPNPEPGTLAIFGIGLVSMAGYGWRRKQRQLA